MRAGYTVQVRFFEDSEETTTIRWYLVPKDRQFLPVASFVQDAYWTNENGVRTTMGVGVSPGFQGETWDERRYSPNFPPDPAERFTGHYCGTPEQWAGKLSVNNPDDLGEYGCCDPETTWFVGCTCLAGEMEVSTTPIEYGCGCGFGTGCFYRVPGCYYPPLLIVGEGCTCSSGPGACTCSYGQGYWVGYGCCCSEGHYWITGYSCSCSTGSGSMSSYILGYGCSCSTGEGSFSAWVNGYGCSCSVGQGYFSGLYTGTGCSCSLGSGVFSSPYVGNGCSCSVGIGGGSTITVPCCSNPLPTTLIARFTADGTCACLDGTTVSIVWTDAATLAIVDPAALFVFPNGCWRGPFTACDGTPDTIWFGCNSSTENDLGLVFADDAFTLLECGTYTADCSPFTYSATGCDCEYPPGGPTSGGVSITISES